MPPRNLFPLRKTALLGYLLCSTLACASDVHEPERADKEDSFDNGSIDNQDDFFDPGEFWFFQIRGIDHKWLDTRNLGTTEDPVEVCFEQEGVTLSIASVEPTSPEIGSGNASSNGCYDIDQLAAEDKVAYETDTFCFRLSGNLTFGTPKPSFKITLGTKGPTNSKFADMKKINLKSMWNDVSQMRESIAWRMFEQADLPASRHSYARLCMDPKGEGQKNNVYRGLFSVIEQVDKKFLKDRESHFGDNDKGNLYKGSFGDVGPANLTFRGEAGSDYFKPGDNRSYDLKTNDDDDELNTYDDLAHFISVINGKTLSSEAQAKGSDCTQRNASGHADCMFNTSEYEEAVRAVFDVGGFLRWAGLNVNVGAWDNYWRTPANYYLYNSGPAGDPDGFMDAPFFHWVPWDMDNTLGIDYFRQDWARACTGLSNCNVLINWEKTAALANGGVQPNLPLIKNILGNDNFLRYYTDWIEHSRVNIFAPEIIDDYIGDRGTGGLWDRIRISAFAEDSSFCRPDKGEFCSGSPGTGRGYSNDQVFHNGLRHDQLEVGSVPANSSQFTLGIHHFLQIRKELLGGELDELRSMRNIGADESGTTFPVEPTPLP
jgi:hypothetical protein